MHPIDDNIGKKPAVVTLPNSLIKMMSTRPVNATDPVIKKWDTLGPMNLNDPKMKNEWSTIDGLHFGQSLDSVYLWGQIDNQRKAQGIGRTIFESGNVHEGMYKDDKRHGYGRFIWSDGAYYVGMWANGMRSGLGQFVHADGQIEEGIWQQGQLVMEMEIGQDGKQKEKKPKTDGPSAAKPKKSYDPYSMADEKPVVADKDKNDVNPNDNPENTNEYSVDGEWRHQH